jgi:hypothetical protein
MRVLAVVLLPVLLCGSARGEPATAPRPGPSLTGPLRPIELCPRGDERCLEQLLLGIPEYQEATRKRRLGVVLTSVGVGVGATMMVVAGLMAEFRENWCLFSPCRPADHTGEKIAVGIGGALAVAGLAAGIPLIVSGTNQRRAIRGRFLGAPVVSLGTGSGETVLLARWEF